jgi:metallophosphoesterase (TIGR00282 family)
MNILCLGDVVGQPGVGVLKKKLCHIQKEFDIDFTVANIENAASGFGFSDSLYNDFILMNIDAFTTGNHVYARREVIEKFDTYDRLTRPLNLPKAHPGKGVQVFHKNGKTIAVINMLGRVFMPLMASCPFDAMNATLDDVNADIILVDFHAETTSEKQAMGWHLDGRVSFVFGTHTHVQTSDARLLPNQTAYMTDLGMCGAYDSVIGMDKTVSLHKFINQLPARHQTVKNPKECVIGAAVVTIDPDHHHAVSITSIHRVYST